MKTPNQALQPTAQTASFSWVSNVASVLPGHAYGWLLKIYYTADGSLDRQHTEASNEQLMPDDTVPLPE
jgi:hypothetical protein